MDVLERCPGYYCGHTLLKNGSWSECGSCELGYRVNESFACSLCEADLQKYSWLYLAFMGLIPLLLHCFFIDLDVQDRQFCRKQMFLTASAFLECSVSAILSLLIMQPRWHFKLNACNVRKFTDWYTLFYNPAPNYEQRLHCTQEAVYPLQTIVLVYYFLCLVSMLIARPLIRIFFDVRSRAPMYAALYFLPLLSFLHTVACGLIYYSFPYLTITISMISNAIHFALQSDQSFKALIKSSVANVKNVVTICAHWLLLAFGIFSLDHHYALLILVPFPSIFYILTARFTDPLEFREVSESRPN